ncbi:hypothetical protein AADZ90_006820 [Aestuariibius sp. 2305UL40-4]|uniref:hypothetical protein n=1 Tax=Aestuariibius violaceus TaxID=3234132 RepID=UPI00345EBD68
MRKALASLFVFMATSAHADSNFLGATLGICAQSANSIAAVQAPLEAAGWTVLERTALPDAFVDAMIWTNAAESFFGDAPVARLPSMLELNESAIRGLRHKVDLPESAMRIFLRETEGGPEALVVYLSNNPAFSVVRCEGVLAEPIFPATADFTHSDRVQLRGEPSSDGTMPDAASAFVISLDRMSLMEKSSRSYVPQTVFNTYNSFPPNEVPQ